MKLSSVPLAVFLVCVNLPALAGQVYQWKDAKGGIHYGDQPPAGQVGVQERTMRPSVIEVGEPWADRSARERYPVTLYTSACGKACDDARTLLGNRGIPFSLRDPQSDKQALVDLEKLTGKRGVPVLVVGTEKIEGYNAQDWSAALDRAGYPATAPRPRQPAAPPKPAP